MFCACNFHGNSMNNLLSYCGLFSARIRASNKDLPVKREICTRITKDYKVPPLVGGQGGFSTPGIWEFS